MPANSSWSKWKKEKERRRIRAYRRTCMAKGNWDRARAAEDEIRRDPWLTVERDPADPSRIRWMLRNQKIDDRRDVEHWLVRLHPHGTEELAEINGIDLITCHGGCHAICHCHYRPGWADRLWENGVCDGAPGDPPEDEAGADHGSMSGSEPTPDHRILRRRFEEAGLRYTLEDKPFVADISAAEGIFQMDIEDRGSGDERFRLHIPHDAEVTVLDVAPEEKKMVLMVDEPVREFREEAGLEPTSGESAEAFKDRIEFWHGGNVVDVETDGGATYAVRRTPGRTRRFLLGEDDRHYFLTEIGAYTTVDEADRGLRPDPALRDGTKRQGEWLFVPLSYEEMGEVEDRMVDEPYLHRTDLDLRGHEVEEGFGCLERLTSDALQEEPFYVRGRVHHDRHDVVRLRSWHRLMRNDPVEGTARGVGWVD